MLASPPTQVTVKCSPEDKLLNQWLPRLALAVLEREGARHLQWLAFLVANVAEEQVLSGRAALVVP